MVAYTTNQKRYFRFKNAYALVRFKAADFTFTKATFMANNSNNSLSGKTDVALNTGDGTVSSMTTSTTVGEHSNYVSIGDGTTKYGGDNKWYYFAVLPGTLDAGFTINFEGVSKTSASVAKADNLTASDDAVSLQADFDEANNKSQALTTPKRTTQTPTSTTGVTYPYEDDVASLKANGWTLNGHEFVDLGITNNEGQHVYFATKNVGAENVGDFGDYYAWGAMTPYYTTAWVTDGNTANGVTAKRESNFYHSSSGKYPRLGYDIPVDFWTYKQTTTSEQTQRFRKSSKARSIERNKIYNLGSFEATNLKSYTTAYGYKWNTYIMMGLAKANSKDNGDGVNGKVTEAEPCIYANSTGTDVNQMILKDDHDVARTWGASWRMPRNSGELAALNNIIKTLRDKVSGNTDSDGDNTYSITDNVNGKSYTLTWVEGENTQYNGHCGFLLTYNGGTEGHNTIFLPSTGWYIGTSATNDSGGGKDVSKGHFTQMRYWSSTRAGSDSNSDGTFAAYGMNMRRHTGDGGGIIRTNRAHGHTIRPIFVGTN